MDWLQALILGLVQGLTEFLPVSSSGHLAIGREILGVQASEDLVFEVTVHAATVLATIIVFRKQIGRLLAGLFKFKYNDETDYILKICVSMIPVFVVGVFFKDYVEALFSSLYVVGGALLLTAALLRQEIPGSCLFPSGTSQRHLLVAGPGDRPWAGGGCHPGTLPQRNDHLHRSAQRRAQGRCGSVLLPHGDSPYPG